MNAYQEALVANDVWSALAGLLPALIHMVPQLRMVDVPANRQMDSR